MDIHIQLSDQSVLYSLYQRRTVEVHKPMELKHFHAPAELVYVEKGSGFIFLPTEDAAVQAGDLVLVRSMESHLFSSAEGGEAMSVITLTVHPQKLMASAGEWVDPRLFGVLFQTTQDFRHKLEGSRCAALGRGILSLRDDVLGGKANPFTIRAWCLSLFSSLAELFDLQQQKASHVALVCDVIGYINQHLTEPITLTDLAHHAHLDVSHFSAVFKSVQGTSPWKYVLCARIELAKSYLRDTAHRRPITEVAAMSGFRNLSNFNKVFRELTGLTPRAYQNRKMASDA